MNPLIRARRLPLELTLAAFLAIPAGAAAQVGAIGLSAVRAQVFDNENLLVYQPAQGDGFGSALAVGDFNGDGADDLATGIPFDDGIAGDPITDIGAVVVRYGSLGRGLRPELAPTVLNQLPGNSPNPAEAGDQFGSALAACDFNGDGRDDLAVGIPLEDHGEADAGAVQIHYGSATGLRPSGDAFYAQSTPGIPGDAESRDRFGFALACGDFDGNGFDDLAIGVPEEDLSGELGAGMVDILPGSAGGLVATAATSLDQDSDGMDGAAELVDRFGQALAAGDFNGDGRDDLAIGVPGESFDNLSVNGAVHVVFGAASGLTATGNRLFGENSVGGNAESFDAFGSSLATGDFDKDGRDDLAIGIPFDSADLDLFQAGRVAIVYGAAGGLDFAFPTLWGDQSPAANDLYGWSLATADFDGDGFDDLAVGHPGEADVNAKAGAVTVLMGRTGGLSDSRHRILQSGRGGFPGDPAESDREFGGALATGDFDRDGHRDLVIGAPSENEGLLDVGQETVLYGALQADNFETPEFAPAWQIFDPGTSDMFPTGVSDFLGGGIFGHVSSSGDTVDLRHHIPEGAKSYRGRFYAKLWPLNIAPNRYFVLLQGGLGEEPRFILYANRGPGENGINLAARVNGGGLVFAPLLVSVPDGWRAIEVDWRSASPGQSNGHLYLTIDGHFYALLDDLDNSQADTIDNVRWGAVDQIDTGTSGIFYLDEYVSKRFTGIGQLASFADTPLEHPSWTLFQGLFNAEITAGCDGENYCPQLPVTRQQMAKFLIRSKNGPSFPLVSCATAPFLDVPTNSPFCPSIRELADRGIAIGCGGGNFCPDGPVTRQQAAVWLQRTREGAGEPPPPCANEPYSDVDRDDDFCPYIQYLHDTIFSAGCGGGRFCPLDPVRRDQLAPLLVETFDLFVPQS